MSETKDWGKEAFVSFFFLGKAPVAPGTFGSFGALVLAYFAIENAVRAFNPNYKSTYNAPFTHEKVLMGLYSK